MWTLNDKRIYETEIWTAVYFIEDFSRLVLSICWKGISTGFHRIARFIGNDQVLNKVLLTIVLSRNVG
jgi:ABC-type uncharacterized transport system YnjBCD permease subunit